MAVFAKLFKHSMSWLALITSLFLVQTIYAQKPGPRLNTVELLAQAEAKSRAKEWKEAARLWQVLVDENQVNGRYWQQLASAHYNAKEYLKAIAAYEKTIELGQGIPSNAAYNIACCYALLGHKEQALSALERAFRMGYRYLDDLRTDTDLISLRDEPRFQKLAGSIGTSKLSREAGWRLDLQLMAREVKRKGYDPFRLISESEFDASVRNLSAKVPKLTDMQVMVEMTKLIRKLGDGHSSVHGSSARPEFVHTLPLQFYFFEEGLFIISADPKYQSLLGSQVIRFGDHSVDGVMKALDPLISRDNEMWPKAMAPYRMRSVPLLHALGLIPDEQKVRLTIRDQSGRTNTVTVETDTTHPSIWNVLPNPNTWINLTQTLTTPTPLYLKNMGSYYWFEYLPQSKIVYFQYNKVINDSKEPLTEFSERITRFITENEVEKLVIDMRWNNGGDTFLNEPLLRNLLLTGKFNQRGKLFVIIGRRTYSAAMNAVCYFERFLNPIFVGEPTGGKPNSIGDETVFELPYSKVSMNVSDLYWQGTWPQDNRWWIAPHIYVAPSFEAFRGNRDSAMEAIMSLR